MKKDTIAIPAGVFLVLDDIGWFRGGDDRAMDQPSRTGLRRGADAGNFHCLQDYEVVNEIGKRANMKINTMFCAGEWDKNHILRHVPYSCKEGKNWDTSEFLDLKKAAQIRDFLNSAEYIELGIHGLLHDFWYNGERVSGQEFYPPAGLVPPNGPNDPADFVPIENPSPKSPRGCAPEWVIRAHLDAFMEIYNDWGFTGQPRTFASPSSARLNESLEPFAAILKDYGVKYWHNAFLTPGVCHGIIMNPKVISFAPWECYDLNPDKLPTYNPEAAGILSGHWVNLLRYDPDCNMERVDAWVAWLNRQAEVFGMMLARDAAMAHQQSLYRAYCTVDEIPGGVRIDLTEADRILGNLEKGPLYISIKKGEPVPICQGGILTEYERRENHINYKIQRTGESVLTLT